MQILRILAPDSGSIAVDAFILAWEGLFFYAFILLLRVLRKIMDDGAMGILVVSWWPSQSWFPLFCHLFWSQPLTFPSSHSLLSSPFKNHHRPRRPRRSLPKIYTRECIKEVCILSSVITSSNSSHFSLLSRF